MGTVETILLIFGLLMLTGVVALSVWIIKFLRSVLKDIKAKQSKHIEGVEITQRIK